MTTWPSKNEELLHLPRADGVILSLLPDEPCELRIEYGHFPDQTQRTEVRSVQAGELALFDLNGLSGGGVQVFDYLEEMVSRLEAAPST